MLRFRTLDGAAVEDETGPIGRAAAQRKSLAREAADRLIERAFELRSGWLIFARADPIWDPLRAEPSYLALLKKLKLDF